MKEDGCKTRHAVGRQDDVRRRPRAQHRAGRREGHGPDDREPSGHRPNSPNYRSHRLEDQVATASSGRASPARTACRCSRTSPPRRRTPSCTARTASPRTRSPTRRRAACRPTSASASSCTVATLGTEELPQAAEVLRRTSRRSTATKTRRPVRHLRLRDDVPRPRRAQARRRQGATTARRSWTRSSPRRTAERDRHVLIDKNGDTTLTDYGLYKIKDGKLTFDKIDQGGGQLGQRHRQRDGRGGPGPARRPVAERHDHGHGSRHRTPRRPAAARADACGVRRPSTA